MSSLYNNKFVKKIYRVLPKLDSRTNNFPMVLDSKGNEVIDKSYDDYYIPCGRANSEIYFYSEADKKDKNGDILCALIYSYDVGNKIIKEFSDIIIRHSDNNTPSHEAQFSKEVEIYFYDKDLSVIAKALKAGVNGAKSIPPTSDKNLPHETIKLNDYKYMPKDWWAEYSVYAQNIAKNKKVNVKHTWNYIYDEISKIIGVDVVKEAEKENYRVSHYIHKNGHWDKFEKYMRENGDTK